MQYWARENRIPAETALSYWDKVVVGVADLQSDIRRVSAEFRRKHEHVYECVSDCIGQLTTEYSIGESMILSNTCPCITWLKWSTDATMILNVAVVL